MTPTPYKGRGAVSQTRHRFEKTSTVLTDEESAAAAPPQTELTALRTVRIISRNQSPDIPFDRSINPYQGCEHGRTGCLAGRGYRVLN